MNTSKSLDDLAKKLVEDLYAVPYHPTDIDACHLHEKYTSQCYGCRHAKWSNIIKAELRERFDSLTAKQQLEAAIVEAVEGLYGDSDGLREFASTGGNQVDTRSDIAAIAKIGDLLNEFYPEVRKAILEYCLFITEKDLEA